jgi:hypothetical protein
VSGLALVTPAAHEDTRWQHWRQQYVDTSRKTETRMRMIFTVAMISALAFVVRALLS